MTLLTNHRITARNKASRAKPMAMARSAKIVLCTAKYNKKRESTLRILEAVPELKVAVTVLAPTPSAPPAVMTLQRIQVWDQEYLLEIPEGFDIYEGLRRWYPELYDAVMEEESHVKGTPATPKMTDEEVEEAWARYDYLEWLSD
jgi:hypothetical protein